MLRQSLNIWTQSLLVVPKASEWLKELKSTSVLGLSVLELCFNSKWHLAADFAVIKQVALTNCLKLTTCVKLSHTWCVTTITTAGWLCKKANLFIADLEHSEKLCRHEYVSTTICHILPTICHHSFLSFIRWTCPRSSKVSNSFSSLAGASTTHTFLRQSLT